LIKHDGVFHGWASWALGESNECEDFGAGNAKHVGKITGLIGDVKGIVPGGMVDVLPVILPSFLHFLRHPRVLFSGGRGGDSNFADATMPPPLNGLRG